MKIYLDRISLASLFSVIATRSGHGDIYYFGRSAVSDSTLARLTKLKLLRARPVPAAFRLGEMVDENGENLFPGVTNDVTAICSEISQREFENSDFLKNVAGKIDRNKLLVFLEKTVHQEISDIIVFLHAARWHSRISAYSKGHRPRFFMEKTGWLPYLAAYAAPLGFDVVPYRSTIGQGTLNILKQAGALIRAKLATVGGLLKSRPGKPVPHTAAGKSAPIPGPGPKLATWYTGRTITFDTVRRSDFFWLLKSPASRQQVLVYFDRTDIPLTREMAQELDKEGVLYEALSGRARASSDLPVWLPGAGQRLAFRSFLVRIVHGAVLQSLRLQHVRWFLLKNMLLFAWQFSYWHDFFSSKNIKVNVDPNDYSRMNVCKHLALEHNGGVSISYQWSNLSFISPYFSSAATVLFSFGPEYRQHLEASRTAVDRLVYCGYITDYSFTEVRERSLALRKELHAKGVRFIICYFDENSSDDRMSVIPNKRSAGIYQFLIERMLEDESLGLIFKPGYPKTLFQRISSISGLIERARATGRCIFMDKGTYVTEQYPAEAAQAADLCIGLLLSGTVALEAYLAGTPTVFLDLEALRSHPLYHTGKGTIVFDDLEGMFKAITKFRHDPGSAQGFGDLSAWAQERDHFKDGNASLRMGQYIGWLLETFDKGGSREDALQYADRRYQEAWGEQSICRPTVARQRSTIAMRPHANR